MLQTKAPKWIHIVNSGMKCPSDITPASHLVHFH